MTFPPLSPVAFHVLGWPVRWYGISYLVGIGLVGLYCQWAVSFFPPLSKKHIDDVIFWSVVGLMVGGRIGYILLYAPTYYWQHPPLIFKIWEGGMSFHGGLVGVIVAATCYGMHHKHSLRQIGDCLGCGVPLALFWGRLGNFINQEHYGRPTPEPWGIIFPNVDGLPRHASQLYEAFAEGLLLFLVLHVALTRFGAARRPGFLCGLFLMGYAVARWCCEWFRIPDGLYTWKGWELTSGQLFSLPMMGAGLFLWMTSGRHRVSPAP